MGFTAAQAARLTGCTLSQLSSWERTGLVAPPSAPSHRYRFQDLVALRVVAALLDAGLGLDGIRLAVRYVAESGERPPPSLVTDGAAVWACHDDGEVLGALRRAPLALFVGLDRLTADVEAEVRVFDAERKAFVKELHDGDTGAADAPVTDEAGTDRSGGANARGRPRRHPTPR
jgi:DNA-binding transcriptional MerR regulator